VPTLEVPRGVLDRIGIEARAYDHRQEPDVEYKHFIIKALEPKPGKWRASIKRLDGKPIMLVGPGRVKLDQFVTGADSSTPRDALLLAIAAVDAGAFSRRSGRAEGEATIGPHTRVGGRFRRTPKAKTR